MDYYRDYRDPENQIQAGFALRAGRLMEQYENALERLSSENQYDATLTICVLQALSANCLELLKAMESGQPRLREQLAKPVTDVPLVFGLRKDFVLLNKCLGEFTYKKFIEHIRNALSHPTFRKNSERYKSTGYTATSDSRNFIDGIEILTSPWTSDGKIKSKYRQKNKTKIVEIFNNELNKYNPSELTIGKNSSDEYQIVYQDGGEPYLPIFQARIPIKALKVLTIELSNYLSQPTRENWDGNSIERLVG